MSFTNKEEFIKRLSNPDLYKKIGKYVIHIPSLIRKNTLKIFYKSGKLIPKHTFDRTTISDLFKNILLDLLENKKFLEEEYNKLDTEERMILDDLIKLTHLDITNNKLLNNHKAYNDEKNKHSIHRFNLLKGQIIAGNDNPEIMKEIKKHILYLKMNKLIDRKEVDEVLYLLLHY